MTERTFNIIMACKGNAKKLKLCKTAPIPKFSDENAAYDNVIAYMVAETGTPKEHYTEHNMQGILFDAFCDYIDTAEQPSELLRYCKGAWNKVNTECLQNPKQLADLFRLVRIMDDGANRYVNGFAEYLAETTYK